MGFDTATIRVKMPQEIYEFLRSNYNRMIRADGSSVVHAEIYIEVDPNGDHYALLPSPYSGVEMLASYIKDTTGENGNIAAVYYKEIVIDKRVGEGEYRPTKDSLTVAQK